MIRLLVRIRGGFNAANAARTRLRRRCHSVTQVSLDTLGGDQKLHRIDYWRCQYVFFDFLSNLYIHRMNFYMNDFRALLGGLRWSEKQDPNVWHFQWRVCVSHKGTKILSSPLFLSLSLSLSLPA